MAKKCGNNRKVNTKLLLLIVIQSSLYVFSPDAHIQDEIEALKSQLVELGTVNTDGEQGAFTLIDIKSTNSNHLLI